MTYPNISIAMAGFNGARFLADQLDSIASQSFIPSELVFVDDCSSDETARIVREFARYSPFEVRLEVNHKNLGHELNFGKAISLCRGDLIFLADQDDVWYPYKIEKFVRAMLDNPNTHVLICDADMTDETLKPSGKTVAQLMRGSGVLGKRYQGVTLGCATAITKTFAKVALPIMKFDFGHDSWIHELGDLLGVRRFLCEPLQAYRRHGQAATSENGTIVGSVIGSSPSFWEICTARGKLEIAIEYTKRELIFDEIARRLISPVGQEFFSLNQLIDRRVVLGRVERFRRAISDRRGLLEEANFFRRKSLAVGLYMRGGYDAFYGLRSLAKDLLLR